jgi:uncharacterized protein with HEPN domain
MPRDPRAYLWDARHAADLIRVFVEGRSWEDYVTAAILSSAVERQLEIIGEALNQLSRDDPETAAQIPELARIVAFRNLLIHGYATVDDALVWSLATEKLADLVGVLNGLLGEP